MILCDICDTVTRDVAVNVVVVVAAVMAWHEMLHRPPPRSLNVFFSFMREDSER